MSLSCIIVNITQLIISLVSFMLHARPLGQCTQWNEAWQSVTSASEATCRHGSRMTAVQSTDDGDSPRFLQSTTCDTRTCHLHSTSPTLDDAASTKCPRFSIFVTIPMSTSVQIWTPILRGKLYSNQPTGYEGRTTKVKQFCQCSQYSVEQHIFPNSNKFLNHRKLHNTIASVYRVGK